MIRAELPGVDPDRDIDVSVDNGVLTIAAERQESTREKLDKGYRSEFRYGSFVRQVRLPAGTSAEVVSAAYKDGVLEIRMPKPTPERSLPPHPDSARLMGTADVLSILISGGNDDGDRAVTGRARSVAAAPGVAP